MRFPVRWVPRLFKHIFRDDDGVWQFGAYFAHLDSIRSRIPEALFDLIRNENRYDLSSPTSLHDAWLVSLKLLGPHERAPAEVFTIELALLGPLHDREFELTYLSAHHYNIEMLPRPACADMVEYQGATRRKDDLITHEFDVSAAGKLEHRLLFDSGLAIFIACADILFRERMIEPAGS